MRYYDYEKFIKDIKKLIPEVKKEKFDAIVGVARGGVSIAHFLASALDNRNLFTINSICYDNKKKLNDIKVFNIPKLLEYQKVLIVDDIVDSGDTMSEILKTLKNNFPEVRFKTLSIFQKQNAKIKADFYAQTTDEWIEFFWEKF